MKIKENSLQLSNWSFKDFWKSKTRWSECKCWITLCLL